MSVLFDTSGREWVREIARERERERKRERMCVCVRVCEREKREIELNLWVYADHFPIFLILE